MDTVQNSSNQLKLPNIGTNLSNSQLNTLAPTPRPDINKINQDIYRLYYLKKINQMKLS